MCSGEPAQVGPSGGALQPGAAGSGRQEGKRGRQTPGSSTSSVPAQDSLALDSPFSAASPADCSPYGIDAWEDALGAAEEHCVLDALAGLLGAHGEPLGSLAQPLDACSGSDGEAEWDQLMAAACRASDSPRGSPSAKAHSPWAVTAQPSGGGGAQKAELPAGEHGSSTSCSMALLRPCAGVPASPGGAASAGATHGKSCLAGVECEGGQAGRRRGRPRRYDVGQLLQGATCLHILGPPSLVKGLSSVLKLFGGGGT